MIDSLAFPAAPPDLADLDPYTVGWPSVQVPFVTSVQFGFFEDGGLVLAEITSLTVPEPSTFSLLTLGLTFVLFSRSSARSRPF